MMSLSPSRRGEPSRALWLAVLVVGCLSASDAFARSFVYASEDVPKAIVDNDFTGITSVLVIPDSFVLGDVDLIFDELLHESVSDLRIELTSPTGTTAVLVKAASEGGILSGLDVVDNFVGTIFDDQAPTNLRNAFFDNHVGSYNVDHPSVGVAPLSVFNGENAQGTWTLWISDRAKFDAGALNAWSLRVSPADAVPEPSGLVLMSLGLVGLVAISRRKLARA